MSNFCKDCGKVKNNIDFNKNIRIKCGVDNRCKVCQRLYDKLQYQLSKNNPAWIKKSYETLFKSL